MEMEKYKLGELAEITSSKRIFEKEYIEKGIPFIRGQEITDASISDSNAKFQCYITRERYEELKKSYSVPQKNDILVTAVGTIGNTYLVENNKEFYFKDGNIIWFKNIKEDINPKYLLFFMKSPFFNKQIEYSLIGAVQKALTIVMLSKIEISLPPHEEQKKIANILSVLDDKIALKRRMNAKLEQMAKQLYDHCFVQFDFPNADGKPYKASDGKIVWDETLKREIPDGWEVKSVNDISTSYRGVGYTADDEKSAEDNDVVLILRGNNISNNHIIYDGNTVYLDKSFVSEEQKIHKYDFVMTMSSGSKEHVGKSAMFLFDSPHSYGAFCNKITPAKDCQFLLENYLHSEYFKKYIQITCSGTGINNLTNEHFDKAFFFPFLIMKFWKASIKR